MTLFDIMSEINNFFDISQENGDYEIVTDGIEGDFTGTYVANQYVRIRNSVLNDGVYKVTGVTSSKLTLDATLTAEDTGRSIALYGLAVPPDFITLSNTIISSGKESSVKSETVSRYSVDYGDGGSHWTKTYKNSLNKYRKLKWE